MTSQDNLMTKLEKQYDVKSIKSEAPNLFYLFDDDKQGIGIVSFHDNSSTTLLITKKQLLRMISELPEIYDVLFR